MQSTLTMKDTDPHDIFLIEPEIVRALRARKASTDLSHDATNAPAAPQAHAAPDVSAGAAMPRVEPTFRAAATDDIKISNERIAASGDRPAMGRSTKRAVMVLFALISAIAAAAWQHYGDTAKAVIANHAPSFVLAWSAPAEKPVAAEQPSAPVAQAAAAEQATTQPTSPAQDQDPGAATAASPSESTQLESMASDLAGMGQQIEQLKASIAQLRAGQEQMSRDIAQNSEAQNSEAKAAEARTSAVRASEARPVAQNPRPKVSAPPVRVTAVPARKPKPAYLPASPAYPQAATTPALPQAAPMLVPPAPAPQAEVTADDGAPVVRPPMPVR
jgi:hypothetical protein